MSDWPQRTIGDMCDAGLARLQTGPFGSQLHAHDYVEHGIPVIPTEAIRDRRINHDVLPQISADKAEELSRHRLQTGDILFARRGVQATGHTAFVRAHEEGSICGTGAILLRIERSNEQLHPEFMSHVLSHSGSISWFKFHAIGATMPNLNEGIVRSFPFALPPIHEQKEIATLLSALDDKAQINADITATLESTMQAIFEDWFQNFGPTLGKAKDGPPYLVPALWSLFPDALGKDAAPTGWQSFPLDRLAVQRKDSISPLTEPGRIFELYSLPAFDSGQEPALDCGASIKSNKTLVPPGTLLLSKLNPEIPRVWIPNDTTEAAQIASTEFLVFEPELPASRALLFCLFRSRTFRDKMCGMVTGTSKSHQRVSPKSLLALDVLCGTEAVFKAFEEFVSPIFERILANRAQSRSLFQTRHLLLPKLMSGQIRLREAEEAVGAVA